MIGGLLLKYYFYLLLFIFLYLFKSATRAAIFMAAYENMHKVNHVQQSKTTLTYSQILMESKAGHQRWAFNKRFLLEGEEGRGGG